ncbi:GNAT family N-acetyltransferase [Roseomonas elaeocarpi]|uniref:GNAT family N-acetyltransferase n=1 Tax=Roseomonas elaeocarpi TaxID=907779 RepID=A0ABV6JX86_9PROT
MSDPIPPSAAPAIPDILTLERAALTATPAPRLAWDGGFVVRLFRGGTGRANAASCLDPSPDAALPDRIARIERDFRRHGLRPRFRSTPLDPPGLEAALRARGYGEVEGACILLGPLAAVAAAAAPLGERLAQPSEDWIAVQATAEHQTPARRAEKLEAAALLARPGCWLLHRVGRQPAAAAHAVADDSLCGFFDVATAPAQRRRGLSQGVLASAAAWGLEQGARHAWLQVSPGNAPALALYARLGLREVYRYRYFTLG